MEKLTFKVNEYEGPLDLILALLSKHQIGIYDINISDLLEQYMAYIRTLRENQMEIASEFLEMASRLVYIKTASLLPRYEKEEDPRAELVGQLLEYQSCKQAAALLRLRLDTGRTHQIRVHMAYIGHPVTGDEVYGNGSPKWLCGQCLHAKKIGFIHPDGRYMEFDSELPDYFKKLLANLETQKTEI